ncbi:putative C-type lectin domain family 20 member A [Siphateles boraxobius]|uniref:putative C-type lectin domain family 20 member A n=1 Tax=Siphateles boraxobius TaxID=180520 RepID=UPI004063E6F1
MDPMLLLVFMSCGVYYVIGTLNPSKTFYFVNQTKAFDEAQRHCRDHYTDLVTLWGRAEMEELFALEDFTFTESAWIGLKSTSSQEWQWSLSDQEFYKEGETEYRNWGPGEPTNTPGEYCSVMDDKGKLRDTPCKETRTFICYNGQNYNGQKYILINELKSWREAQSYCRQVHTDLVSVRNPDENLQIQKLIPVGVKYIGLYRDPFVWSDSNTSSFRNWASNQPDGSGECVAQQLQDPKLWDDQTCSSPRPFFCYAIPVFKQVLRLELESDQNLNDPDVKATILQEIQQRLISQGVSEMSNLQWRQQPNGNIFQARA